jgi:hypothetical protein
VQERPRRRDSGRHRKRKISTAKSVFGSMAEAGSAAYVRSRDLPKLIRSGRTSWSTTALKAAATYWPSSAGRLGPNEGALSRVIGAMTSIGISA